MDSRCFIGIDTSNYTTSAAVCDIDGNIVANIKLPLPVSHGERGLRQSDAVFLHTKNMPELSERLKYALQGMTPSAVGYSAAPRSADGSYMPCFLVGEGVASAIGAVIGIKGDAFSHQDGHIAAALYSSGKTDLFCGDEFVSFHVSGGTTDIMLSKYNGYNFDVKLIGESKDINVGQAIDRVGVAMGLNFPCGREMESLALSYNDKIPRKKVCVDGCSFNISGLENLSLKLFEETHDKALVSAFVFDFISVTLDKISENVRKEYPELPIAYAGGVMSNSIIKNVLSHRKDVYFASPDFSSDNASGIAYLTYIKRKK